MNAPSLLKIRWKKLLNYFKLKRMRQKTQKDCDKLLSPLIKKLHPKCLLCGGQTQVAHHYIKKSISLNLRYNLKNLIPLCSVCHFRLHFNDEGLWNGRIALMKGKKWLDYLEKNKKMIVKINYDTIYKKLQSLFPQEEIDY